MYYQHIDFNSSAVITLRWADFIAAISSKSLGLQYVNNPDGYTVFALDNNIAYKCLLMSPDFSGTITYDIDYSQAQNDIDFTSFVGSYITNTNQRTVQTSTVNNVQSTVDGRWITAPNAFPGWVTLYFAGRGDDQSLGISQGPHFQMASDGYGDTTVDWQFNDIVFLLGATLVFTGAQIGDTIDYILFAPATATGVGTTQVNLANVGPGNIIVPAAGTGQTTIDLGSAVPVPNVSGTGFWDWAFAPTGSGTIAPNATQTGSFDLFDFQIPLGHPVVEVPIIGQSKAFDLLVESVTSMQILPQWVHHATLHNGGHTGLQLGWIVSVARAKTT